MRNPQQRHGQHTQAAHKQPQATQASRQEPRIRQQDSGRYHDYERDIQGPGSQFREPHEGGHSQR